MNISKWLIVSVLALAGCAPDPIHNPVQNKREAINAWKQRFDAVCSGAEFKVITDKSPCDVANVGIEAMADNTKITAEQKPVFVKFRRAITGLNADFNKMARAYGGATNNRLADLEESMFVPEDARIAQELYEEKITWGEYLQKRKDLNARIRAETQRITAAD